MAHRLGIVCALGVGPERGGRDENEDNYLVCDAGRVRYLESGAERVERAEGEGLLVAVCDGMGGHDNGQLASTTAVRVLAKLYRPGAPRDPARTLLRYIRDAHRQLYWRARNAGPVTMGTTLTACWLLGNRVSWAHVGDSRLYLYRNGQLVQLTPDHTRNEFARRDGLPPVANDYLCQTFIFGSRGIGDNTALRLEAGLDSGSETLIEGDRLLLCSDGVTSGIDDATLASLLSCHDHPQEAADALLAASIARGSTDNVTALVILVEGLAAEPHQVWMDDAEETVMF